jgi:DNA polymerase-3 subunit gamma/tau
MLATAATPVAFADDVLTLELPEPGRRRRVQEARGGKGPSEDLRGAILAVLGSA